MRLDRREIGHDCSLSWASAGHRRERARGAVQRCVKPAGEGGLTGTRLLVVTVYRRATGPRSSFEDPDWNARTLSIPLSTERSAPGQEFFLYRPIKNLWWVINSLARPHRQ